MVGGSACVAIAGAKQMSHAPYDRILRAPHFAQIEIVMVEVRESVAGRDSMNEYVEAKRNIRVGVSFNFEVQMHLIST